MNYAPVCFLAILPFSYFFPVFSACNFILMLLFPLPFFPFCRTYHKPFFLQHVLPLAGFPIPFLLFPFYRKPFRSVFSVSRCFTVRTKSEGQATAVDSTLRRLIANAAGHSMKDKVVGKLAPNQYGFGVRDGAKAAAHAARSFL
jgi:hypothetical protein